MNEKTQNVPAIDVLDLLILVVFPFLREQHKSAVFYPGSVCIRDLSLSPVHLAAYA